MNFLVTYIRPRSTMLLLIFVSGQSSCNVKTVSDQRDHSKGRRRKLDGRHNWAVVKSSFPCAEKHRQAAVQPP